LADVVAPGRADRDHRWRREGARPIATTRLTPRQLNRATLGRQLLLARSTAGVLDAIRAVLALQAQSPASPYIGLWSRIMDFDPVDLDRAFADHAVVKATLMRMTLHAVAAEDHPALHRAMVHDLRRGRLGDPRFTRGGISIADADALVPEILRFAARARTKGELEEMVAGLAGEGTGTPVIWAYRHFAPLVHAPTGGPWSFGDRPSYVAARTDPYQGDQTEAVAVLVRRYLEAFGPASESDFGQFSMLPRPRMRAALEVIGGELETFQGPDGTQLYDLPGGVLPQEDTPAPPRLLPMWDNALLAYRDRSRIVPEPYRRLIAQGNGDTLPAVLVDGYVAGVWRPSPDSAGAIEVTAFHRLDMDTWDGLAAEARSLVGFLSERQPTVYARYARWWRTLPAAEVRQLAG
jgi:DNA glycosylase AlkZ-like